jgi:FkbM family methyltransferase
MIKRITKIIKNPSLIVSKLNLIKNRYREWLYVNWDSNFLKVRSKSVLFVDLGANLGQGYSWFSRYFNGPNVDFELFEPNPNCFVELAKLPDVQSGKVMIHNTGVGAKSGRFTFYGLTDNYGGRFSQGGSILQTHNSNFYTAAAGFEVDIVDFSLYLKGKNKKYQTIVVKMDIEGAEVELLEKMIADDSINLIDYLYVEFHSQYQDKVNLEITKKREVEITNKLRLMKKFHFRIWH